MGWGGLKVLADGEDLHPHLAQVSNRLAYFVLLLADAQHNTGLGRESPILGVFEHRQGTFVGGGFPDGLLEALDRFEVVVENVGIGVEDKVEGGEVALEIGSEHLDGNARVAVADRPYDVGPDLGSTILEVIAGDGGENTMLEIHL